VPQFVNSNVMVLVGEPKVRDVRFEDGLERTAYAPELVTYTSSPFVGNRAFQPLDASVQSPVVALSSFASRRCGTLKHGEQSLQNQAIASQFLHDSSLQNNVRPAGVGPPTSRTSVTHHTSASA